MNRKMVFHICGQMMLLEAVLMLLPLVTALFYGEKCVFSFVASMGIALALGAVMMLANKPKDTVIYSREGFCITALTWVIFSLVGSLPFVISGEIPSFVDAFFETVSGFTTTGASILRDVESMSKGLLMWRSFTHWVGGMGILVMVMAVLPMTTDRSIHIMRAEMPGPIVGKGLIPRERCLHEGIDPDLFWVYFDLFGVGGEPHRRLPLKSLHGRLDEVDGGIAVNIFFEVHIYCQ